MNTMKKQKLTDFRTLLPGLLFRERVFRKLLPVMLVAAIYAIIVVHADKSPGYVQKLASPDLGQFHLMFSFILTIVIGFRVNTSYSRWWEARILWGGITNNCRNLALKFNAFVGLADYPAFCVALQQLPLVIKGVLRRTETDGAAMRHIKTLYATVNDLRNEDVIRMEQYLALDVHIANLMDLTGGCERIRNTPSPRAYALFVKQTLFFYTLMFPFGWVDRFGFLIVPIMLMMVYILLGLEMLSEELEEPFSSDDTGLRLDEIANNIAKNVEKIACGVE